MNETRRRRLRDRSAGAATLINLGCKVTGLISGDGDFLINGEVDGDCDIKGTVTLAPNGYWRGTIKADTVIVSGHVDGDIVATGPVEITASAKIAGTVAGEAIAVAEGAIVEGVMQTSGQAEPITFVEKREPDG
ncbi:MAG: polymer-forming cytoskeletal protein [Gammaproteobacteria bacterium]|nr:polymer-forming cytoskeletal protein [Gammaproteobacteria bacterium]MBU2678497.1 polymer-forming cytoskeletal protein [Gammaproteobacteria bacterium]NNC56903.1 polymer-forming cytoskeletal protein [Woeseiaceae bacterium]NNL52232.1 polymer-forming cytoskeletal protein [Woeseiaceae bacterium]